MTLAIVTSKGQITIPAEIRRALNVKAGDRVEFVEVEPGRFEVLAATRSIVELKGLFGKPAKAVSINDMNRAIAGGAAKTAGMTEVTANCATLSGCSPSVKGR